MLPCRAAVVDSGLWHQKSSPTKTGTSSRIDSLICLGKSMRIDIYILSSEDDASCLRDGGIIIGLRDIVFRRLVAWWKSPQDLVRPRAHVGHERDGLAHPRPFRGASQAKPCASIGSGIEGLGMTTLFPQRGSAGRQICGGSRAGSKSSRSSRRCGGRTHQPEEGLVALCHSGGGGRGVCQNVGDRAGARAHPTLEGHHRPRGCQSDPRRPTRSAP